MNNILSLFHENLFFICFYHFLYFSPTFSLSDNLEYQAQSPDEAALVTAARNFGFTFVVKYLVSTEVCFVLICKKNCQEIR